MGLILELGRSPGEGKWQPTPTLLPGKFHGQRSLVGYSPWDGKESDMTEAPQTKTEVIDTLGVFIVVLVGVVLCGGEEGIAKT